MPFTPVHMGPGIAIKALLQGSFSLMVFGWTQIVMDLQPLFVILTGEGHLHGFSHTYIGATLLALLSALTGKYLAESGLKLLSIPLKESFSISWPIAILSAFIGSFSHVFLDSIMHGDVAPFFPFNTINPQHGLVSIETLHKVCLYCGLFGGVVYYTIQWIKYGKIYHD